MEKEKEMIGQRKINHVEYVGNLGALQLLAPESLESLTKLSMTILWTRLVMHAKQWGMDGDNVLIFMQNSDMVASSSQIQTHLKT